MIELLSGWSSMRDESWIEDDVRVLREKYGRSEAEIESYCVPDELRVSVTGLSALGRDMAARVSANECARRDSFRVVSRGF